MELPPSIEKRVKRKGGAPGLAGAIPGRAELERQAGLHKALSDPARLGILALLSRQPLCPCVMKEAVDLPDSRLSYHLSVLRDAGLIEGRQEGNWIVYQVTKEGRGLAP